MDSFINAVAQILADFRHDGLDYLAYIHQKTAQGDEAMVRQKIVEPLLAALGYDLAKEVQPEERAGSGSADIYVQAIGQDPANDHNTITVPASVWELKRTGIHDLAERELQLQSYVLVKHVRYGVLTNGHEIRLYERIGERIELTFTVHLAAFAANAPTPATDDDKMALIGLYDLLHRDSFLAIERYKQAIVKPPHHTLRLSPEFPHNEDGLIDELKQVIRQLKRLVVLNFNTHQQLVADFEAEKVNREQQIKGDRQKVLQTITDLQDKLKMARETAVLENTLSQLNGRWMLVEETQFIKEALSVSTIEPHLQGADRKTFENRTRNYFRAVTSYRLWLGQQSKKLTVSHRLVNDFEQWQVEIGIMVAEPVVEFCLQTVYIFITRLLLIRICEDKGLIKEKISDGGYNKYLLFTHDFLDYIGHINRLLLEIAYEDTSYIYGHFFSKSVFDWYNWEEGTIVRLLAILNPYNFKDVSADLIGRVYEEYVDELERKRKGQFYTPANVVAKVLDAADYKGEQIAEKRLLDPACGSGRFLVEASRRLIPQLEKTYRQHNQPIDYQALINDRLRHSLYGLDINRFACFLAEVNLVVQVLDLFQKSDEKFTILRFHIYPTNSLLHHGDIYTMSNGKTDLADQEHLVAELIKQRWVHPTNERLNFRSGFDYVVGNPPYVKADNPSTAELRQHITQSGLYNSLYKKWDLFIPFIELALKLLAENGRHAFIVSDSLQTEEYASKIRERLLRETTITYMGFAPNVYFFEGAAVYTFIYGLQNSSPSNKHRIKRELYLSKDVSSPRNIRTLPALRQTKWGEQLFRPAFEGEDSLDFDKCMTLGQICYINTGLELQSHEKHDPIVGGTRKKLFIKEELLSNTQTATNIKPYVESDELGAYVVSSNRWLEWDTKRVPAQLRRSRFPELFENEKIIISLSGNSFYDATGKYYNQANSVSNCVPYHKFVKPEVLERIAKVMAREITDADIAAEVTPLPSDFEHLSKSQRTALLVESRAQNSPHYDLRYLTALLNCRWLHDYMMAFVKRGSRERFYPNDLKQWPVAVATADAQAEIADMVRIIMDAKSDIQQWHKEGHIIGADDDVTLNPRVLLEQWRTPTTDLLGASAFVTSRISQSMTRNVHWEGEKIIFRQNPECYVASEATAVQEYLYHYLTAEIETLYHVPAEQLIKTIRIPKTVTAVEEFMTRFHAEELRLATRWMDAVQRENLIEEMLFDLYDVVETTRETMSGKLYKLEQIPADAVYVSLLQNKADTPFKWVAFPWQNGWAIRTPDKLPHAVLLWHSDGQTAHQTEWHLLGT